MSGGPCGALLDRMRRLSAYSKAAMATTSSATPPPMAPAVTAEFVDDFAGWVSAACGLVLADDGGGATCEVGLGTAGAVDVDVCVDVDVHFPGSSVPAAASSSIL